MTTNQEVAGSIPAGRVMIEDVHFMNCALDEARKAYTRGDVPVGAVAVCGQELIARAHNAREYLKDPTAHAEMLVLQQSAFRLKKWRLSDLTIYVTLEPCSMCAGALVLARVARLVFGAFDPKTGAAGSVFNITANARLNHQIPTQGGILEHACKSLLTAFFLERRKKIQ